MLRRYLTKLENIIAWAQSMLTEKQFILSSVLVGISSAFAVIVHLLIKFSPSPLTCGILN
jgi:CIC family chloride channel protein